MSDPTVEEKARGLGWVPLEEFRGSADRWVDADTFVRRGEELLPLVKAQNKKLESELQSTRVELRNLVQAVQDGQESIKALREFHEEDVKRQVEVARRRLRDEIVQARKDDDVEAELEAQEALGRLKDPPVGKKEPEKKPDPAPQPHPDFPAWQQENAWYGINHEATGFAMGVAQSMQANPATRQLTGRDFLDRITERVAEKFPQLFPDRNPPASNTGSNDFRGSPSKVESSRLGSGRSNGRVYADLPAEAREACERFIPRVVGKTRAYKSADEWRAEYVRKYFSGDEYV